jgi:hypothetical protein
MGSFTHVQPGLSVSFKQKDKKNVAVFLLLGEQPKDGSSPLDLTKAMNALGWYSLQQKSPVARKRKVPTSTPKGRGD